MLRILLHSSKTMRTPANHAPPLGQPALMAKAVELAGSYRALSDRDVATIMKISPVKAKEVQALYQEWSAGPEGSVPAVDAFIGDIYSGLQAREWSPADRAYAHERLLILSGLYGGLRACDGILPYRLEMGYKLPDGTSLYSFWQRDIAALLAAPTTAIVNLSAVEYTKAVLPYVSVPVVTPKFLTVSPKTGQPTFVTVHAKIARGAFANWMIKNRVDDITALRSFGDLGYAYDENASTPEQPVFVCQEFQGLGLSVRLLA